MKNQVSEENYQQIIGVVEKKSRKETYGKKNTRYKRTGYDVFIDGFFNPKNAPYGYNFALGYCQDTISQDNSVI